MRVRWRRGRRDHLNDALTLLSDWNREGPRMTRRLAIDDSQHAALTERIKVAADALHLRPEIRRIDGQTQITLSSPDDAISEGEVALAARIEDAYRAVTTDT